MDVPDRDTHESNMARALAKALRQQMNAIMAALGDEPTPDKLTPDLFEEMHTALQAAIRPTLEKVYLAQVEALTDETIESVKQGGIGVDWGLVNQRAADWASAYSFELVTGIVDTTRNTLQKQVTDFMTDGRTITELRAALEPSFGPVRADMIAQTEVTRAAQEGEQTFKDELESLGLETTLIWITNNDEIVRQCPICWPLHNKLQGDGWTQPPPAHPRCILPGNEIVIPGSLSGAAQSFYDGRCVEFTFLDGRKLAVTENHPILTRHGWVAAKFLREGEYIIRAIDAQRIAATVNPDNDHRPTSIEQVFSSHKEAGAMLAVSVPATPVNFYGDGHSIKGEIEIIFPDRFLLGDTLPSIAQPVSQDSFGGGNAGLLTLSADGLIDLGLDRDGFTLDGSMSICEHCGALFGVGVGPSNFHALGDSARLDASFDEALAESPTIDPGLACEFALRFASEIALDQIVQIRYFDFAGHVYDLQVDDYELYICNGVIVKNCRCWTNTVTVATRSITPEFITERRAAGYKGFLKAVA